MYQKSWSYDVCFLRYGYKTQFSAILGHFLSWQFFEWQSYDVWFLRYEVQQAKSFLILDQFLSFYWKIKTLKKKPGDIISLLLCPTNDNHMMYGSLDIRCNRQFFGDSFLPFYPPTHPPTLKTWKIKIPGGIIICIINA